MDALGPAAEALDRVRAALRVADLQLAEQALAEHDACLRAAVAGGGVAVSELEFLGAEQAQLLQELIEVRDGVRRQLVDAGRNQTAARAYQGTAGA